MQRSFPNLFVKKFTANRTAPSLPLGKFAREVAFNIVMTQRVSRFGQHYRIDDLVPGNLRGDKCPILRQFFVCEFHLSAVFQFLDPLPVWHVRSSSAEDGVCVASIRCSEEENAKRGREVGPPYGGNQLLG